ncbi:MAG: sensor domain-containing diguanylate cyclase [Nitrospiraceae bacterium]|nr:MAG: sensor domain-containing diguanylate cyclase [Nitrospiraceae bacterium]
MKYRNTSQDQLNKLPAYNFRAIFDNAGVSIVVTDPRRIIIDCNAATEYLLGYTREELLGKSVAEISHPEDEYMNLLARNKAVMENEKVFRMDKRYIRKDGQIVYGLLTVSNIFNDTGETELIIGIIEDITERKKTEAAIKESEEKFHNLFNHASDSVFLMSVSANDDLIIEDANEAAYITHGYTREELIGNSISMLDDPMTAKHIPERIKLLLRGKTLRAEGTHVRKDGSTFPVEISAKLIVINGKPYVIAIDRDITKRKLHETELKERMKIAELGYDIGRSLTGGESLRKSLQSCTEALVLHLNALFARIWTFNNKKNVLELQASAGLYTHIDGKRSCIPVSDNSKVALIAREQKPHLTNQVIDDPMIIDQDWAKKEGIVSFAGYPLVTENRLIGVMSLFSRNEFSDITLRTLESVSDIITIGIMQKQAEDAVGKSREIMMHVLDGIDAVVYAADMHTYEVLYINEYSKKLFGNITGKTCWQALQSGQTGPCSFCTNDRLLTPDGKPSGIYHWEFQNTITGKWYDIRDRAIEWVDGRVVRLEIASDITSLKEAEQTLRSMSFIDDLTGLHNRRGFMTLAEQQLKTARRDKKRMLCIFADLDNMKWINDTLGHPAGDPALKDIANILKQTFRESDIIARTGGDEFVILATETVDVNSESLTGRLQKHLDAYNAEKKKPFTLSLSIGITHFDPEHPCPVDELIYKADTLMYKHKHEKRAGRS